ncbi:MAG: hypothetical protein IT366_23790 [Candidatus Hydrogenedentes bacterium]|nr:hypothetical protein [Candidatus Hydrogenedentota bacterium]
MLRNIVGLTFIACLQALSEDATLLQSEHKTQETFLDLDSAGAEIVLNHTPLLFLDWSMVDGGQIDWVGPDGNTLPLNDPHGLKSPEEAHPIPMGVPSGVAIRAQPAEKRGVFSDLLPAEFPWEEGKRKAHTLLFDDSAKVYRVWYDCAGGLAYAESDDLKTWRKPLLNASAFRDQPSTNLVYIANLDACRESGMFQRPESLAVAASGTVFVDPSTDPSERYKTTILASATPEKLKAFAESKGKPLSSRVSEVSANVLFPAVSADGVSWRVIPEPDFLHDADTQTVVFYDTRIKKYVLYTRLWEFGRRSIGRSESDTFLDFPLARPVLRGGANESAVVDFYANAMARYPGRDEVHLMFVTAYDRRVENSAIRLASSRDGVLWDFVSREAILLPGAANDWDSHFVIAPPSFVRAPDGDLMLLYNAYNYPHKFPRAGFVEGNQGTARWKADRIAAIEAVEEGYFNTPRVTLQGNKILLNVQTARAGEVRVELRDASFAPIAGRSFEESDPITGDDTAIEVTWKGSGDLSALNGQRLHVAFRMRSAKLFAVYAE